MVILIREIEGGTDSNNRKITVIIILNSCTYSGRALRVRRHTRAEEARLPVYYIRVYALFIV